MLKSLFWIPKISNIRDTLTIHRSNWINIVKNDLSNGKDLFGNNKIIIKDKYMENCVFPVSSFQIKIIPNIALNNNLITKEDANKFFPMLTEAYCSPFKDKYESLINRYNEAEDSGNLLTRFTFDVMDSLIEENITIKMIGSLLISKVHVDILIYMTQLTIADAFNDNNLAREALAKIHELVKFD